MTALIFDFQEKLQSRRAYRALSAGRLRPLRDLLKRYEDEMWVLRDLMSEEELTAFEPMTPEQKIEEDVEKLKALIDELEATLVKHPTLPLRQAWTRLKYTGGEELCGLMETLEGHSYPTFVEMMHWLGIPSFPRSSVGMPIETLQRPF